MNEREISRQLAAREQGTCEVRTPVGLIDVLTAKAVYEVKEVSHWKAALGQVLAYARYYPQHQARLYLYGKATGKQKAIIHEHCAALKVRVVWHREPKPDDPPPVEPAPPALLPDELSLLVSVFDKSYSIRSTCTVWLTLPDSEIRQPALQAYLDEGFTIFDALLDNDLTLTLRYRYRNELHIVQRQREQQQRSDPSPACYRLNLTIMTEQATSMQMSLPAIRRQFDSGHRIGRGIHRESSTIPELKALFAFILRPDFPWRNKIGFRATSIQKAYWVSYGMNQTRTGWKIGR